MNAVLTVLRASPLTGILLTLLAYRLGLTLQQRSGGHPLCNSVLLAILMLSLLILAGALTYDEYMQGARFIHLLLGPATVALAVPLHAALPRLRKAGRPLLLTLLAGSLVGIGTGAGLAWLFGMPPTVVLSLLPRSVTTPIAMAVAQETGGIPALAAAFVIMTGILGAALMRPLFAVMKMDNDVVCGFATGLAAHGVGTARAFQQSELAGAFAGLAMGLNGLLTPVLIPVLLHWIR